VVWVCRVGIIIILLSLKQFFEKTIFTYFTTESFYIKKQQHLITDNIIVFDVTVMQKKKVANVLPAGRMEIPTAQWPARGDSQGKFCLF